MPPVTEHPALPTIARLRPEQSERVGRAITELHELDDALEIGAATCLRHLSRRQLLESLAAFTPVRPDHPPAVLPPRRRFLTPIETKRRDACAAAITHVDTRLTMLLSGHLDALVGEDTPTVLHGMLEAADTKGVRSNAGLVRLTDVHFADDGARFVPPPGDQCPGLLRELVRLANAGPRLGHEPIEVASWLAACLMTVHPFVDGNGRTARCLFQLVHSAGIDTFDWVSLEMWSFERDRYVGALQDFSNGSAGGWYPERLDAAHFLDFTVDCLATGTELRRRRASWFATAWEDDHLAPLDEEVRIAALCMAVDRNVSAPELDYLVERPITAVADELVGRGLATRTPLGLQPAGALLALVATAADD